MTGGARELPDERGVYSLSPVLPITQQFSRACMLCHDLDEALIGGSRLRLKGSRMAQNGLTAAS